MKKLATKIVDISNDVGGKALSGIVSSSEYKTLVPEELKKIEILTGDELEMLPDSDFALILVEKNGDISRKYPKPDFNHALVSGLYLADSYEKLPDQALAIAAKNLLDVLDGPSPYSWEIVGKVTGKLRGFKDLQKGTKGNIYRVDRTSQEDELRKAQGQEIREEKEARAKLADCEFAFVSHRDGKKHRLFPIENTENIKKATAYFDENYKLFTPGQRHMFSLAVQKQASKLKVEVESDVMAKYASSEWSPSVIAAINTRIDRLKTKNIHLVKEGSSYHHAVKDHDLPKLLRAYEEMKKKAGKGDIHKFANLLYALDKASGLEDSYGKTMSDAYTATYSGKKTAGLLDLLGQKTDDFVEYAGKKIGLDQLENLDPSDFFGIIARDVIDEIKSAPKEVFDSLPAPYKSAIVEVLFG